MLAEHSGPSSFEIQQSAHNASSSEPNTPIKHASGFDYVEQGWNKDVMPEKLKLLPGVGEVGISNVLQSATGSLDSTGIIAMAHEANVFTANPLEVFDGSLGAAKIGHEGMGHINLSGDVGAHHSTLVGGTGVGDAIDVLKGGGGQSQG